MTVLEFGHVSSATMAAGYTVPDVPRTIEKPRGYGRGEWLLSGSPSRPYPLIPTPVSALSAQLLADTMLPALDIEATCRAAVSAFQSNIDALHQAAAVIDRLFEGVSSSELVQRLESFGRLEEGWAGPGTLAPSDTAVSNATKVLQHAKSQAILPSRVIPADESVFVHFSQPGVSVDVECENDGTISAVLVEEGREPIAWLLDRNDLTADLSRIRAHLIR